MNYGGCHLVFEANSFAADDVAEKLELSIGQAALCRLKGEVSAPDGLQYHFEVLKMLIEDA